MHRPIDSDYEERELIACSLAGDQNAFAILVHRYQRLIISIVYRMTGQPQLAEDLAQEAFIKAWVNLPRFRGDSSFRSWLGRIATNLTIDHLRRSKPEVELMDHWSTREDSPQASALQAELRQQVRDAVLELPIQSRAALVLREYEGLSYKEIAEMLDIPMGTVMSRLNYARTRLRDMLKPETLAVETPQPAPACRNLVGETQ
jgi:RNA polymerase sigma-70 factor, ECF subfamily